MLIQLLQTQAQRHIAAISEAHKQGKLHLKLTIHEHVFRPCKSTNCFEVATFTQSDRFMKDLC